MLSGLHMFGKQGKDECLALFPSRTLDMEAARHEGGANRDESDCGRSAMLAVQSLSRTMRLPVAAQDMTQHRK